VSRVIVEDDAPTRVVTDPGGPTRVLVVDDEDQPAVILEAAVPTSVHISLETVTRLITVPDSGLQHVVSTEEPGTKVVYADPDLDHVLQPVTLQHVTIASPDETGTHLVAVSNMGPAGSGAQGAYEFVQPLPESVWTIDHGLGFDPAGITVTTDDGYQAEGFVVQYTVPGQSLRLTADIPLAGTARLS